MPLLAVPFIFYTLFWELTNKMTKSLGIGISIIKLSWFYDRLSFIMVIPIPTDPDIYIASISLDVGLAYL